MEPSLILSGVPFGLLCSFGFGLIIGTSSGCSTHQVPSQDWVVTNPAAEDADGHDIDLSEWELVWRDEFDYPDEQLDRNWESQNGPNSHIICSRWRENAVVEDGILHLVNRKESRGGQEWTSGSIWTRETFQYGYFECRYRYAEAQATNNSFWLMMIREEAQEGKRFEIDINEGHYPNEVNTNIHNWTDITVHPDGRQTHPSFHKGFSYGTQPGYSIPLEIPVTTRRLRFSSETLNRFHVRELRVYGENDRNFSDALSDTADRDVEGLVNHALDPEVEITASGFDRENHEPEKIADGRLATSWLAPSEGERWIEFAWPEAITVGCLQFVNGWRDASGWHDLITDYRIQYHDGTQWQDLSTGSATDVINFGTEYHLFGLEWNRDEIIFYLDRKEIRRVPNDFCFDPSPIWLSLAIIEWAGPITDALDGTSMKVDWVRVYQRRDSAD